MPPTRVRLAWTAATLLTLCAAGAALASQPGDSPSKRHATPTLLAETTGVQPGAPLVVAVHFEIEPEWHLYWRNPGDAGLPPRLEWSGPSDTTFSEAEWPTPEYLSLGPLATYGLTGSATLLIRILPPATLRVGDSVAFSLNLKWLVCREACVPEEGELSLRLPVVDRAEPDGINAAHFAAARARLPRAVKDPLRIVSQDERTITIEFPESALNALPDSARVFVETGDLVEPAGAMERVASHPRRVMLPKTSRAPREIRELSVVLVPDAGEKPLPRSFRVSTRSAD